MNSLAPSWAGLSIAPLPHFPTKTWKYSWKWGTHPILVGFFHCLAAINDQGSSCLGPVLVAGQQKPHAGFNNLATSCSYFLESIVDELYEFSFFHDPLTRLITQVFLFLKDPLSLFICYLLTPASGMLPSEQ